MRCYFVSCFIIKSIKSCDHFVSWRKSFFLNQFLSAFVKSGLSELSTIILNIWSELVFFVLLNLFNPYIRLGALLFRFCKMSLFNLLFFESLTMPGNKYCTLEPSHFTYSFVSSLFHVHYDLLIWLSNSAVTGITNWILFTKSAKHSASLI